MTVRSLIKPVVIAIGLLLGCFPIAIVITIATAPVWSWFESAFRIESFGHSGPAAWCYLAVYGVLVALCSWVWYRSDPGHR